MPPIKTIHASSAVTDIPSSASGSSRNSLERFKDALQESRQAMKNSVHNTHVNSIEKPLQTGVHFNVLAKPIDEGKEDAISVHEHALALRAYRTQLLASNSANADTPQYKAVDIDVDAALRNPYLKVQVKYSEPSQRSVDGNSVEMDVERVKFMDNALRYEYSISALRDHFQELEELIKNSR